MIGPRVGVSVGVRTGPAAGVGLDEAAPLSPPLVAATGTYAAGVAAITVTYPTHRAGQLAVLVVETCNQTITLSTPAGFTQVGSTQGTGVAGTDPATALAVFTCPVTSSSMTSPVVADSGDHQTGCIFVIDRASLSSPVNVSSGGVVASADTAVSATGLTTTVPSCLVLAFVSRSEDSASTTRFSGWANSSLIGVTEILDDGTAGGNGGGIGGASGTMVGQGVVAATTATLGAASVQAFITIAIAPAGVA